MKIVSKVRKLVRLTLRARIAAAFAKIASAVDANGATQDQGLLSLNWGAWTFPELIAIRPASGCAIPSTSACRIVSLRPLLAEVKNTTLMDTSSTAMASGRA
jgi:hypothetical protein